MRINAWGGPRDERGQDSRDVPGEQMIGNAQPRRVPHGQLRLRTVLFVGEEGVRLPFEIRSIQPYLHNIFEAKLEGHSFEPGAPRLGQGLQQDVLIETKTGNRLVHAGGVVGEVEATETHVDLIEHLNVLLQAHHRKDANPKPSHAAPA